MKIYRYMAASALLLAVAACSNDDDMSVPSYDNNPDAVRIQPSVSGIIVTRTTPEADNSTAFATGDQIKVSRDGADFYLYNKVDNGWTPERSTSYLMWGADETEIDLQAYYPAATASMASFTLPDNQSSTAEDGSDAIAKADYMTFNGKAAKGEKNAASFAMQRRTARIRVTIDGFGDQYAADSKCSVKICSPHTTVGVDYSGTAPAVTGSGDVLPVTPLGGADMAKGSTATALVVPSVTEMSDANFMVVTVGSETLYVKGIPAHKAGYSYTYRLTVGKNDIAINSVQVNPWNDPTPVDGGTAEEKTEGPNASTHNIITQEVGQIASNSDWIATAINGGTSLKITGPMNDTDIEALKTYLVANPYAALELDLSKVTELTTFPNYGFSDYNSTTTLGLKSIVFPSVMTKIEANAFNGYCTELESVTLPAGLEEIGGAAFFGCSKLSTLKVAGGATNELPKGLTKLEDGAFRGTILETITIPSSLTTTTLQTLNGMASLKTVYWNSSAETPFECFGNCTSLTDIYFTSENAPTIGNNIFGLLTQAITIHIPAAYEANYSAWKALEANNSGWNITCTTE